ncbi:hypothetical protein JHK82_024806 [Glycine max]|nr:hypothetical protein JHK85_025414 [Glycine max]KAG5012659.1 hypothetical protein JHK86_024920 [Glycine max]KAG5133618.1 hypothetical protein JHK82_024806 [Glycine max]
MARMSLVQGNVVASDVSTLIDIPKMDSLTPFTAYFGIHKSKHINEADLAHKRLIFDEFFYLQGLFIHPWSLKSYVRIMGIKSSLITTNMKSCLLNPN